MFHIIQYPFTCNSRRVILSPHNFASVSVKENDIQEEETTAGKDENEITHRPSGDLSGAQPGENGVPFRVLRILNLLIIKVPK